MQNYLKNKNKKQSSIGNRGATRKGIYMLSSPKVTNVHYKSAKRSS